SDHVENTHMALKRYLILQTHVVFAVTVLSAGCSSPQEVRCGEPPGEASRGADTAPADTVLVSVKDIDAKAPPILHQMCAALDGAKAMQLRVRATMDRPTQTGQLAQFHRTSSITVARPDRLHSKTESDEGKWVAWYRGTTLTVLDVDDNSYATQ